MDASSKSTPAVSKLLKVWENRQAQQAARVGGLGLMAVSLAACGGSSDSTTTTTPTTPTTPVTVTPVSLALTVGNDALVGTSGNDTFSGARIDTVATWTGGDTIAAGAGTDTLTATITGNIAPANGAITGVENLVVTNLAGAAATITFSTATTTGISGVTSISNVGSTAANDLVLTRVADLASITLNNTAGDTTVTFADALMTGTSDSLTLNVNGNTGAVDIGDSTGGGDGFETIVINASGAASTFAVDTIDTLVTAVTVTGSANLDINAAAAFASLATFDASAATGDVDVLFLADGVAGTTNTKTITTGSGADDIDISNIDAATVGAVSVNAGAGNDTVTLGAQGATDYTINGGAGTDTIVLGAVGAVATHGGISNFETLELTVGTGTNDMVQFTGNTGFTAVHANAANGGGAQTLTISNVSAAMATLQVGANGANNSITVTNIADGSADRLAIVTTAAATVATLSVAEEETLTLNTDDGAFTSTAGTVTDLTSLTVSGSENATLGTWTGAAVATVDVSGLTGAASFSATFTSSASMTVTANTAASGYTGTLTITTGSADDTITGTENNDGITGGGGNDTINGGGGVDTIAGGAGNDTINGGAGADIITGGSGIDTITTGAGADTLHFDLASVIGSVGGDIVTDFTHGAGGDVIDMSSMGNTALGALVAQVADGTTAAVAHADNTILFLSTNIAANYDTKAEIATLFAAGAEFAAVAQDDENVLIISAADTGHSYVWMLVESNTNTSLADDADTVSLVATLQGVSAAEAALFVAGNFVA